MLGDNYWNPKSITWIPCLCCTIDPLSVDVRWSYLWNGPNSSIIISNYTSRTNYEAICLIVLFFYGLPRHTNIMKDKGFNFFDQCDARCVHLIPLEEEYTSSSWGDGKMYTYSSMANLQRMQTEINESGTLAKVRI